MTFWDGFSQIIAGIGRSFRVQWGRGAPPVESADSDAGVTVSMDNALTLSAAWACTGLISQTVGSLPLSLYRRDERGRTLPAPEHPLEELLHFQPNANMTAVEFWEMLCVSVCFRGNGYAAKRKIGDRVIALDPWLPQYTTPYLTERGLLRYRYEDGAVQEDLAGDDVLHIKGMTADGLVGLSPIAYGRQSLGRALATEQAAGSVFKDGLTGRQIYTYDKVLQKNQRDDFRALMAEWQDATKRGQPFLLEGGLKYQGVTMNPDDAELLATREFSIEDICRWFWRTPPQLIGHTNKASSWASSLENTNLGFLTYSLRPLLTRIEMAVRKSLLSPAERPKYFAKFSLEALLRADSAGRAALHASAAQNGWRTRNEIRDLEDLDPLPGGDTLTAQSNLVPLEQLGQVQTPEQTVRAALLAWLRDDATEKTS